MCYSVHFIVILLRDQYKWELRLRQAPQIRKSHHFRIWNHLSPNWKLQIDGWIDGCRGRGRGVCVFVCVYRSLQTVQEVSFVFVRSEWLICLSFSFPICPSRFDTYVTLPARPHQSFVPIPSSVDLWPHPQTASSVTHLIARLDSLWHKPDSSSIFISFPLFHISCYAEF